MKYLLFTLCLFVGSVAKSQNTEPSILDGLPISDPVTIRLINHTGFQIDNMLFGCFFFPSLAANDSTGFFKMDEYVNGDYLIGSIQGLTIDNGNWIWHCLGRPNPYGNQTLSLEILLIESPFLEGKYRLITKIIS